MAHDYNNILQKLCHHIGHFASSGIEIVPESDLINQLAIDSVKLLNLVMEIEDEFDISIPINVLADVQTVRDLADLIHKIKSAS